MSEFNSDLQYFFHRNPSNKTFSMEFILHTNFYLTIYVRSVFKAILPHTSLGLILAFGNESITIHINFNIPSDP